MNVRKIATVALTTAAVFAGSAVAQQANPESVYLFSYFLGNGETGLHLAYSHDGLRWTALKKNQSFLTPKIGSKLMPITMLRRKPI